jgi:hypothetical protein
MLHLGPTMQRNISIVKLHSHVKRFALKLFYKTVLVKAVIAHISITAIDVANGTIESELAPLYLAGC